MNISSVGSTQSNLSNVLLGRFSFTGPKYLKMAQDTHITEYNVGGGRFPEGMPSVGKGKVLLVKASDTPYIGMEASNDYVAICARGTDTNGDLYLCMANVCADGWTGAKADAKEACQCVMRTLEREGCESDKTELYLVGGSIRCTGPQYSIGEALFEFAVGYGDRAKGARFDLGAPADGGVISVVFSGTELHYIKSPSGFGEIEGQHEIGVAISRY